MGLSGLSTLCRPLPGGGPDLLIALSPFGSPSFLSGFLVFLSYHQRLYQNPLTTDCLAIKI